jgi:hypothetical protein
MYRKTPIGITQSNHVTTKFNLFFRRNKIAIQRIIAEKVAGSKVIETIGKSVNTIKAFIGFLILIRRFKNNKTTKYATETVNPFHSSNAFVRNPPEEVKYLKVSNCSIYKPEN